MVTHLNELTHLGSPPNLAHDVETTVVSTPQIMYLPACYYSIYQDILFVRFGRFSTPLW
jgi:hypothetical protein